MPVWPIALVAMLALFTGGGGSALVRRRGGGGGGDGDGGDGDGDGDGHDDGSDGLRPGERAVRTGFSSADDPMTPLDGTRPLIAGRPYHFWLELGPPVADPALRRVQLDVVLFGYEGEFDIVSSVGELELAPDGAATVRHHGGHHPAGTARVPSSGGRVLFPVQAPDTAGTHRVRCSLYHRHVLVQSWVVSATVEVGPARMAQPGIPAITRDRDYVLSRSLDPAHLDQLAPHQLSLMLNDNGDGNHSLRVFGEDGFESTAPIGSEELGRLSALLREQLEAVACERAPGRPLRYRYDGPKDVDRLERDLIRLARFGYDTYIALVNRLGQDAPGDERSARRRFGRILRRPGRIQVANRRDATDVVPAAFLYDHPLDSKASNLELCVAFVEALAADEPLEASACFRGFCPSHGRNNVVCPSGFWGFRHVIGVPQSIGDGESAPLDMPLEAGGSVDAAIPAGVSTDPGFSRLPGHMDVLRGLDPDRTWDVLDSRNSLLQALQTSDPALVYFYCHGGTDSSIAYIQVGPLTDDLITGSVLAGWDIEWDSRPLVIVNGCNTAAVGPETPIELVTALVGQANAAGVIGTQVTVFESLACAFAETFLRFLLVDGESVGVAIHATRLALLKEGNPLGLVYIPFVSDEVRIPRVLAPVPSAQWQHA